MQSLPVDPPFDIGEIEAEVTPPPPHWSERSTASARVPTDPTLRALLEPLDEHTFVTRYFGRQVLHVPASPGRRAHRDILTLPDLLDGIAGHRIPVDHLTFLDLKGDAPTAERYGAEQFVLAKQATRLHDFERIRDYVGQRRGSIAALGVDNFFLSVWRFMAGVAEVTGSRVGANAYYTPVGRRIFTPHWDTHDVLVVQLHGTKRWRLYDTLLAHPLGQDRPHMESASFPGFHEDLPFRELTLREGDLLYLPAGTPHAAWCEAEDSLHLTGQLEPPRWHDVLADMVGHALRECEKELALRLPCPGWFLGSDDAAVSTTRAAVLERFRAHLQAVPLTEVLDRYFADHLPMPAARPIAASTADLDAALTRTPGVAFVHDRDDVVELVFLERRLRFPREAAPALRWLLERRQLRARDLPDLDDDARRRLARRLVDEGFLRAG
jgi:bifunctional lysine-specific demethylase and histidyl-hydroxylase NO66